MARLNIEMTEAMKAKVEARAAEMGQTVEEYVRGLIDGDANSDDYGAPAHLSVKDEGELERLLLERVKDGDEGVAVGPGFWDELKRRAQKGGSAEGR